MFGIFLLPTDRQRRRVFLNHSQKVGPSTVAKVQKSSTGTTYTVRFPVFFFSHFFSTNSYKDHKKCREQKFFKWEQIRIKFWDLKFKKKSLHHKKQSWLLMEPSNFRYVWQIAGVHRGTNCCLDFHQNSNEIEINRPLLEYSNNLQTDNACLKHFSVWVFVNHWWFLPFATNHTHYSASFDHISLYNFIGSLILVHLNSRFFRIQTKFLSQVVSLIKIGVVQYKTKHARNERIWFLCN